MKGDSKKGARAGGDSSAPMQSRALKTRATLLQSTDRIVAENGLAAVTTTYVAEVAGVAVGTLYRYFNDRETLLLAAYDASVDRIVDACAARLADLPKDLTLEQAARWMLAAYLDTALADPAHSGLLVAMRSIRPTGADQSFDQQDRITAQLIRPFLSRFPEPALAAADLRFLRVLLGTLVDLYLTTPQGPEREHLATEIEAHMLLGIQRATCQKTG